MNELQIVTNKPFCGTQCDFYQDTKQDIVMTREQIGQALEYKIPADAVQRIHERHTERLDKFSVTVKLTATDGKSYNTIVYSAKGIYEICRWSRQPKANAFMDWVWDIIEGLRTGTLQQPALPTDALTNRLDRLITLLEQQYQPAPEPLQLVDKYLTREEMTNYLKVSMPTVDRILAREDFSAKIKATDGHVLIDRELLDQWLKEQTRPLTSRKKHDMAELQSRKFLTKDEAAFYISVSIVTFGKIMKRSDFYPLTRIGHKRGRVFVNREKLDQWINEQDGSQKLII